MANLIVTPSPTLPTKTHRIDTQLRAAAEAQLRAYNAVRLVLYGPSSHPFDEATVTANVTEWATNTTTGLTYLQLQQAAQLAKASLNLFQTVLTDSVVPASISFGE